MNKIFLLLGLFVLFLTPQLSYGQHDITIDRFIGYKQSSGVRGTVTAGGGSLTIERTGTAVKFGAILRRPDTSTDVAGIGLYIGAAPAINSVAGNSTATANGDGYTVGTGLGAAAGGADWNIDPANTRTYLLDLTSTYPPSYSFTISSSTPGTGGAVAGSQRNIYLAVYDVFTHVIFAVSQPIVLNFVDTPPSTFQPVITRLNNTSSGYDGTLVEIMGTGFDYTRHVYLGGMEMIILSANPTIITAQVPTNAVSGLIRVQVSGGAISNGVSFTVLHPTSPPVITHVDNVSNGLYYPDPLPVVLRPNEQLRLYSSQNRTGIALSSYNIVAVDFNGVRTTNFFLNTGQGTFAAYDLYVVVPQGVTPGNITLVTAALGTSNGLPYRFPRPQSTCGTEICADQYVPYGTAPSPLLGRILAWGSSGLIDNNNPSAADIDYLEYKYYFSSQLFAELTEYEAVQWQISYTNNGSDWQDISGANGRDYQPSWCFRKTYYRRVSTHQLRHWWGGQFTDHWYDSNTITITPYQPVADGLYNIHNRNTGQVLEIGGTPLVGGTHASQWPITGTANQQWMVTSTSYGVHKIINRNSGQALEIGGGATQSPGAAANQWPYWGGNNQQWRLVTVDSAPNYVRVVSVNSGQVLEIGGGAPANTNWGAQANQWPPYAGDYNYEQQWQLVPVAPPTASARFPGVYNIRNVASGKMLEVSNSGTSNGDIVQQWDDAGLASQQWIFEDAGGGLFNIKNRNSGKSLDVYVAGQNNGDLVQQWQYGAGDHQKWEVVEVRPGVFRITSYHTILAGSPKSLDVDANRITQNGVQVQQWQYGGASNQEWNISYVSYNRGTPPSKDLVTQSSSSQRRSTLATATLLLYPNPASNILMVTLSDATPPKAVTIRDLRGAVVVADQTLTSGRVDVSALAAGTYLVTVSDGVQEYHQKFTKQ